MSLVFTNVPGDIYTGNAAAPWYLGMCTADLDLRGERSASRSGHFALERILLPRSHCLGGSMGPHSLPGSDKEEISLPLP
jgi:hypothetical protein